MRIALCDDEPSLLKSLEEYIMGWAQSKRIQVELFRYESAEAFIMAWPDLAFDLAFLDIQMKDMTGIELARQIRETDGDMLIVFVTGFAQYALHGYDVNALHYLIKPVSKPKLYPILDKARLLWKSRLDEFMLITGHKGKKKVHYSDVLYISMKAHQAVLHTDKAVYEIRRTMDELLATLPSFFVRCHRTYIVNLFRAECVYRNAVLLCNEERIPISRNSAKLVGDAFLRFHTGNEA